VVWLFPELWCISRNLRPKPEGGRQGADDHAAGEASSVPHDVRHLRSRADKRRQLLGGQQLYLNGLRSVVKRAGWDPDRFDGVYAYLSVHSHSAPTSFYRMEKHQINFSKPSEYQFGLAGFSLEHADQSIRAASKRLIDVFPELFPEIMTKKIEA